MRYSLLTLLLVAMPTFAAESLPAGAKIARLSVSPPTITLNSPFAYSQLLVTAQLDSGDIIDATRMAQIKVSPVASINENGLVRPVSDGNGALNISLGSQILNVPVKVSGTKASTLVSFVQDVQPLMSKLGCNAGTCHGAQAGKNGFKLSLRGYDPIYDHRALTDDLEGRRFNRAAPERSLMLMKAAGGVPHVGGVLFSPGEPGYELMKQWIAEGVTLDLAAPRVARIEISPKNPTLPLIGMKQQFRVIATFTDGKTRDVSSEAFIESSNTEIATVDKTGLITSVRRGESTMLARYEGAYDASTIVVMGNRAGFNWQPQPVLNYVDEMVDTKLKKMKIQPNGLCDDSEFIRRIYIDLTGIPPSSDVVRAFLADSRPSQQKRESMIDQLIGQDAFVDHWTNKWADLLQVNRKFLGDAGAKALRAWIRNAIKTNMPYDKFCFQILTASGSNIENPPASYFKILRDADTTMENTTQLFLAIRFNCNKCHDHPFERWTQDQYYQLAAYFAQVGLKEDPKYKGQRIGGTAVEGAKPLAEIIEDRTSGDVKHARTNQVSLPKFPYTIGEKIDGKESRRKQVAEWITSDTNPYFAKSYVNRMWSYLTGVGIIEPVDDIRAGNPPTNPELLDKLTNEFIASKFDVRKLIRTICVSRTYQLSIHKGDWNKDDEVNYSRAIARRLPAEVLYDAVHKATGSISHLPGMPAGATAAQLLDSNVELPGGFLDLLGKPVRESACECERTSGMMLGPVLAFVSGPVVGDAVQDPNNHIAKYTVQQKDDKKVVEEVYLSVLNRLPTTAEMQSGVKALNATSKDFEELNNVFKNRVAALDAYKKTLDAKQKGWEASMREQKPTAWKSLTPLKATSKAGATPADSKSASKLEIQKDGSILVSGPLEAVDVYTIVAEVTEKAPITGLRLEVLSDASLPAKGPGRAPNGNFVLNEFRINHKMTGKTDEKPKPVKLINPLATYSQDGMPVSNAIDNNPATGWAINPQAGIDHAALFQVQPPLNSAKSQTLTFVMDQRFGGGHTIGKFRFSVTTDKSPKLQSPVSAELAKMLDTPEAERTDAVKQDLRRRYLAQDKEYQRLAADAAKVPPSDPRVLGAQDLTWALLNSPAFLFNR